MGVLFFEKIPLNLQTVEKFQVNVLTLVFSSLPRDINATDMQRHRGRHLRR